MPDHPSDSVLGNKQYSRWDPARRDDDVEMTIPVHIPERDGPGGTSREMAPPMASPSSISDGLAVAGVALSVALGETGGGELP